MQSQRQENYKVSLERLWAPWRTKYIYLSSKDRCIFCEAIAKKDAEAYVLSREAKAFVVMNIFPYNNGHLMIAPYRHVGVIGELTSEEVISMFKLVQESVRVLEFTMNPDGFNIGINVGTVAGAGVRDHIHIHVVPRWVGDTNFMPVISETKVICQSLKEGYKLLKEAFGKC
ncbi:MAG: HIT domain-containing protein [bacterium]|nr:HIT domain-containing protein [bacterium]